MKLVDNIQINLLGVIKLDENGQPKRDLTLQHPRCVINLPRQHVERYTPEMVSNITGVTEKPFKLYVKP